MFAKGDVVEVIDDALEGVVQAIKGETITIKTEDGFLMNFEVDELVKIEGSLAEVEVSDFDVDQVLQQKKSDKPKKSERVRSKDRTAPPMEVDLHIHQIVRSSKHMANHEMLNLQLDHARHKLEFAIKKRIQKIVFIHGKGEGVLKMELEYLLGRYSNIKFYDADYQKYGLGATEVYVYQNS